MMNKANWKIKGPSDLYDILLTIKNGLPGGGQVGCTWITKKQCKETGIEWSFVQNSVHILGLKMNRQGPLGYLISK